MGTSTSTSKHISLPVVIISALLLLPACCACGVLFGALIGSAGAGVPKKAAVTAVTRVAITRVAITKIVQASTPTGAPPTETPTPTLEVTPTETLAATVAATEPIAPTATLPPDDSSTMHSAGEPIQLAERTITLDTFEFTEKLLQLTFIIENTGTNELNVSIDTQFHVQKPDGTKLELDLENCGTPGLEGAIPSKGKVQGNICYKGPFDGPVLIYYFPDVTSDEEIIWQVEP